MSVSSAAGETNGMMLLSNGSVVIRLGGWSAVKSSVWRWQLDLPDTGASLPKPRSRTTTTTLLCCCWGVTAMPAANTPALQDMWHLPHKHLFQENKTLSYAVVGASLTSAQATRWCICSVCRLTSVAI